MYNIIENYRQQIIKNQFFSAHGLSMADKASEYCGKEGGHGLLSRYIPRCCRRLFPVAEASEMIIHAFSFCFRISPLVCFQW